MEEKKKLKDSLQTLFIWIFISIFEFKSTTNCLTMMSSFLRLFQQYGVFNYSWLLRLNKILRIQYVCMRVSHHLFVSLSFIRTIICADSVADDRFIGTDSLYSTECTFKIGSDEASVCVGVYVYLRVFACVHVEANESLNIAVVDHCSFILRYSNPLNVRSSFIMYPQCISFSMCNFEINYKILAGGRWNHDVSDGD